MFDRLDQLEARYEDLGQQMSDPTLVQDQKKFQAIAKQHRTMEPTVEKFREYRKIKEGIAEAKAMRDRMQGLSLAFGHNFRKIGNRRKLS